MKKKQDVTKYYEMEANVLKKSSFLLLGYQPKVLKILQNGTKIGYRNPQEPTFLLSKTFNITDIKVEQVDAEDEFELITTDRVYQIKTINRDHCRLWLRAICALKKELRRKNRKKQSPYKLPKAVAKKGQNDSTLPSISPVKPLNVPAREQEQDPALTQTAPHRFTYQTSASRNSFSFDVLSADQKELKQKFREHFKKLSLEYLQYHVYIGKLSTKLKEFMSTNLVSNYYIMFSSKSLYPDEHISQDNLTSAFLPHWADIDCFYRVAENNLSAKLIFEFATIKQVAENEGNSMTITAEPESIEFYFQTEDEERAFKGLIDIAYNNTIECKNRLGRKNYDSLILLHSSNLEGFDEKIKQLIEPLVPQGHQFQPWVIKKLTDNLNPLIVQILTSLENKVNSNEETIKRTIIDFIKIIHEEVKRYLKLVWDTSHAMVKGIDVLNILKAISTYQSLVNRYVVKDKEIYQAEKQLSKIYVRTLYRNFQKLIINIVEQEKNNNYHVVEQQDQSYSQTYAITDIFKFIYDFFKLAIPCWNDKLHLHNIHKLVKRSLGVFINELKSMVDEVEISTEQMMAIANNYVAFNEQIETFYEEKFSQLQERTKQSYDYLKDEFREVSMVIIDRLVAPLSIQLKVFFNQQQFFTAKIQKAYALIIESDIHKNMKLVHFIFKKRYYQRIFSTIREEICKMLQKEVQKTKKPKEIRSKVIDRINQYKADCNQMLQMFLQQKLKIAKELNQVITLLTTIRRDEIAFIMTEATYSYKKIYKQVLQCRDDFKSLNTIFESFDIESPTKQHLQLKDDDLSDRKSFSRLYMQEFDRNSVEGSSEKIETPMFFQPEEKVKMISEGYILRNKYNSGNYEKIYLKLKKSVLYIYVNEKSERSQNTIQIEDIEQIKVPNQDKPNFTITFKGLHKTKQLKFKCLSVEDRMRWTYSIDCQLRRLKNDKKMKVIKMKDLTCNIIIDYDELQKGKDYFSYGND